MTDASSSTENQPGAAVPLPDLANELLDQAKSSSAGRAARTVAAVGNLRITLIALASGTALSEHENPGAATVHVLTGAAVLTAGGHDTHVGSGCMAQIPDTRHGLRADEDAVVLLTVALS